ncbi:MAG: hypothetical protein OEU36_21205 [Gammaproteobacteria bacterium]|nr:hypothetical protein [Gammaproteobacteria bacterium]
MGFRIVGAERGNIHIDGNPEPHDISVSRTAARYNKILNIVFGAFFILLTALFTYLVGWYFYKFFAAIETVLTALVVWYAWEWPKAESAV